MATGLALILLASNIGIMTPAQRTVVARAESKLLAPCCYSQAVGQHLSAEAAEMRQQIEAMAASGQSEAAIVDHYKQQYGERILVVPDGKTGTFLFTLPLAVLIVCSAFFFWLLPRVVRTRPHSEIDKEERDRLCREFGAVIERELRDVA